MQVLFRIFFIPIILLFTGVEAESILSYQTPARPPYKKVIQPLPTSVTKSMQPLIVLDAGHGGSDEGAKVRQLLEKKITLSTVILAKKYLEDLGYRVILTRSRDVFVSLPKRCSIANKNKGSLFVSVHFNASKNKEASGIEIYYSDGKDGVRSHASKRLANCILYYLIDSTGAHSRGVKKANFHVIRETNMPAILVEGGFMTNKGEWSLLRDRAYLDRIAKAIAEGVHKYQSQR